MRELKMAAALAAATALAAPAAAAGVHAKIRAAPPNTPVKLEESATGGRLSPGFFWSPGQERFVYFAGLPAGKKSHYDIEHFDPEKVKWTNAYPEGAPYKVESGPTDAPVHSRTRGGVVNLVDENGVSRIPLAGGYYANSAVLMHHQYALDPAARRLYALFLNRLAIMDVEKGAWRFAETNARTAQLNLKDQAAWGISGFEGPGTFTKNQVLHWAAFCWDPVNKEALSIGGCGMRKGGTPGTWVFKTGEKKWVKLEFGTPELKKLQERIEKLRDRSWALLSSCRSRFFVTESPEEAEVRLSESCGKLRGEFKAFTKDLEVAKLPDHFEAGRRYALGRVHRYAEALRKIEGRIDGKMSSEFLLEFRDAHRLLESAVFGLDDQPSGRAHSPAVWDPVCKKIVLFGGEGQDRTLGDTWVYDPKTRTWEQRYPEPSPAPRAAHVLAWLPGARKVALIGGYSKDPTLAFEVWTYDAGADRWQNLQQIKAKPVRYGKWPSPNCPNNFRNLNVVGAAAPGDLVVMVESKRSKRITWAMKVDPARPSPSAGGKNGVAPAGVAYTKEGPGYYRGAASYKGPAYYERVARIEAGGTKAFFENLPANKWVRLPEAPVRPAKRDYGTCRYDPVRKQFLWWGGGHVNYWGTEVSHYGLRSGCWTASEVPDEPLEPCFGMCLKVGMSFRGRPHIPSHAYQYYDYDYTSGLLLVAKYGYTYVYNVAERRWEWPLVEGSAAGIRATSRGAIGARNNGTIVRFDARERRWVELPVKGAKPPQVQIDYSGFCYDSKRDCLWYFNRRGVYHYEMKTGTCTQKTKRITDEQVKGYLREMLYVPELDLVMFENRSRPDHDKHHFWDPENLRWLTAEIPLVNTDGRPPEKPVGFSTGHGFMRDPETKLLLVNGGREAYALRLDPEKLKFAEVKQ